MKTAQEYEEAINLDFPDDIKQQMSLVILSSYEETSKILEAEQVDSAFKLHLAPQIRHYLIQTKLKAALRGHSDLTTRVEQHEGGNESYTVVESKNFYLTVSMVRTRKHLPRPTPYRSGNAALNNIFSGWDHPAGKMCYAILTHVPTIDNKKPKSIDLLIPDSRYRNAELAFEWTHLIEFQGSQTAADPIRSEEVETPTLRFKEQAAAKKVEGA